MNSVERPDLLLDETVSEITGVFEVEHVFPEVYKEVKHERTGLWGRIKSFFGLRRNAETAVRCEQRAAVGSGEEHGPGEGPVPGCCSAAAKLPPV